MLAEHARDTDADPLVRRLYELSETIRDRPISLRLSDGRRVPVTEVDLALARLKVTICPRQGKPVPAWIEKLAAGPAEQAA